MNTPPSKTIEFSPEVCAVIAAMTWEQHGTGFAGAITQLLERPLYVAVNKALTALGGKWNRQAQAHLFPTDPRPRVTGLLDTETLTVVKDGYFPTPRHIALQMIEMAQIGPRMTVLEPSAGTGELAEVIRETAPGCLLKVIELNEQRVEVLHSKEFSVVGRDFLTHYGHWDRIIQNPPFERGQDITHIRHAYKYLHLGGRLVSVISEGPFFRMTKRSIDFRTWLSLVQYGTRQLPHGTFQESGSGACTRLLIVQK